ncbi:MAG: FkbM family methyltransferase [Bacteroidota bacterium]
MKLLFKIIFREPYRLIKGSKAIEFLKLVSKYGDSTRYLPVRINFSGFRFHVPDALSFVWQYKEIFADECYKFPTDNDSPVIYDCGSNVGLSCLYFHTLYPKARIRAFEADKTIAGYLEENLKNNGAAGTEIICKAVWINNDGIDIAIEGADGASIYSDKFRKERVPSVRLKELLESETAVDMLKMDIEGAESEVLLDCGQELAKVKNIFIEYHSFTGRPQRLDEILSLLSQNGFRYFMKQAQHRDQPLVNRTDKNFPDLDLLLNIFAYRP